MLFVCLEKSFFSTEILKIKVVFINTLKVNPYKYIFVASVGLFYPSIHSDVLMA